MKRFVTFNTAGFATGFYFDESAARAPADWVEVTEEQWWELLLFEGLRKWDPVTSAIIPYTPAPNPIVLNALKDAVKAQIDIEAERSRLKYITTGSGQAMEYQAVNAEASRLQSDPAPNPALYPMLSATVGIDLDPATGEPAADIFGVARSIEAAQAAWSYVGSMIRQIRLATKDAIDKAPDEETVKNIVASVRWP